ncbi:MAG: rRNA maturation RNase YbeY [candidate division Zixibacteria bacterium]|nr:rRNA maturation RNase YbeY [candidate division Zixibacteria bacterium]MDD5425033.1 rRNA maturation RNase YbeY [candidate division Zixibacteria bacterium]
MLLRIYKETPSRIPVTKIKRLFEKITSGEAGFTGPGTVNLIITKDKNIRRLNRSFRRQDRATDVLSFNIDAATDDTDIFGEIYISAPTALKQAAFYGVSPAAEYLRLFCHGLLHLAGYDHRTKKDEKEMQSRTEHYLGTVGS